MVSGEYSKYNEAVLADDEIKQIETARQNVNTAKNAYSTEKNKLNKDLKAAVLGNQAFSTESVISAKKKLRQQEQIISQAETEISAVESSIQAAKSQVRTPQQLEAAGYKKQVSNNQIVYYKEDSYSYKTSSGKKRQETYVQEEYVFSSSGTPIKIVKRDDYSEGDRRKVDERQVVEFNQRGAVTRVDEYNRGEREKIEMYDEKGRIKEIIQYNDGEKSDKKIFTYDDTAGTVNIYEKDYEARKKAAEKAAKDAQTVVNKYEVYDSKTGTTSTRTLYKDGSFEDKIKSRDVFSVKLSTNAQTGVQKEEYFGKQEDLIKTITKTPVKTEKVTQESFERKQSLKPEVQNFYETLNQGQAQTPGQQVASPQVPVKQGPQQTPGIINQGANEIRSFGQKMQNFQVDDKQNALGVPKFIEKGVRVAGAGVETFGEMINVGAAPIEFVKSTVRSAERRGQDGEYGFQDIVLTSADAYQSTASNLQQNAPTVSKVVDKDLDTFGSALSAIGQDLKSRDYINNDFESKVREKKQVFVEKVESFKQDALDLTYSGYEQTQKPGIKNKLIGTAKQDAGIALLLVAETGKGVLTPIETAKVTEKKLSEINPENKVGKVAANVGEVAAGGSAYAAVIISDPKTYIAGEFEEAAVLARKPVKRGVEIVESVATNPKDFLKASIGETIFVTGAFGMSKAALTDVEFAAKGATNEIQNIAIDNANSKIPEFKEDSNSRTPFDKPEYVSLESVEVVAKTSKKSQGFTFNGDYVYNSETVITDFNLPTLPKFNKPEVSIGKNTKVTAKEVGLISAYSFIPENSLIVGYKNDNKSELGYENRNVEEVKFDNKTKQEYKFDEKYDNKFYYKYDYRVDERVDEKVDYKFDYKLLGQGTGKKRAYSFGALKDDGRYVSSLGGALTGKLSKNPTKDITGLKIRAILVSGKRRK